MCVRSSDWIDAELCLGRRADRLALEQIQLPNLLLNFSAARAVQVCLGGGEKVTLRSGLAGVAKTVPQFTTAECKAHPLRQSLRPEPAARPPNP